LTSILNTLSKVFSPSLLIVFLMPNQQCQSTEGKVKRCKNKNISDGNTFENIYSCVCIVTFLSGQYWMIFNKGLVEYRWLNTGLSDKFADITLVSVSNLTGSWCVVQASFDSTACRK